MSAKFYNRYVPPTPTAGSSDPSPDKTTQFVANLQKRKRAEHEDTIMEKNDPEEKKRGKKMRNSQTTKESERVGKSSKRKDKKEKMVDEEGEPNPGTETNSTKKTKDKKDKKERKKAKEVAVESDGEDGKPLIQEEKPKKRKKEKEKTADAVDVEMEEAPKVDTQVTETKNSSSKSAKLNAPVDVSSEPEAGTGHSRILQKLRKSLARSAAVAKAAPEPAEGSSLPQGEQVAPVGLQSLPQPAPVTESKPISAFSSLPLWLQKPVTVAPTAKAPFSEIESLSPKLIEKLLSRDITEAFAVQSAVLPILLRKADGDVCISAATGSGKTLAYVLPVIQSLLNRCVIRLRAIIVVPTRELVQQVNNTATSLISGTGLKIGVASGSKALSIEQAMLISNEDGETNSKVDILITTPGRLVEHVRSTPGFDLAHVKWLVIDEADRLLAQSFQEWVDVVIGGLEKAAERVMITQVGGMNLSDIGLTPMRHYTRKVVLSATMTRDVGKLAELRLRRPTLVVVEDPPLPDGAILDDGKAENELEEQFSVPAGLREHVIPVENIELKPLCLMYLLQNKGIKTGALVFVKSNEGAARLAKLLETVGEKSTNKWNVGLVTGEMEKKRREKVLKRFAKGEVDLLICSDLISRGLDLPHVRHIVNYDIPASTRAYIHRVGRTARAGKEGDAWTLLSDKEARWFWGNIGKNIRRSTALAKVSVDVEMEGYGLRGIYESVLYGAR